MNAYEQSLKQIRTMLSEGALAQAEHTCQRLVTQYPDCDELQCMLGNIFRATGRLREAAEHYSNACEINPERFSAQCNLGTALSCLGKTDEALVHFHTALRIRPNDAVCHNNIGLLSLERGHYAEAEQHFRRALQKSPDSVPILTNLGNTLRARGAERDAEQVYRMALSKEPQSVETLCSLGILLGERGEWEQGKELLCAALRIKPDHAGAHYNLGVILRTMKLLDDAILCFRTARRFQPLDTATMVNEGECLMMLGDLDAALSLFTQALDNDPSCGLAYGNLLACMNYRPACSPHELYQAHRDWGRRVAITTHARVPPSCADNPERVLRVGYVSPDFCRHPAAYFLEPLLTHRDRSGFSVVCFANNRRSDTQTKLFQSQADAWVDTTRMSDEQLFDAITRQKIDILVDCAGHTNGNRLPVFAGRPALLQFTGIGYPFTTGLPTIDYRISDAIADPPGEPRHHTEELIRLPCCFTCFAAPHTSGDLSPLPAQNNGCITFGSLHNPARLNTEVLSLWARVLSAVPRSRLLVFRTTLSPSARNRIYSVLVRHGVDKNRLLFENRLNTGENHFSLYSRIDVSLDTFPWSGHVTSCESLWMGVPVVTLRGNRHAGRMVASVLTHAGYTEWIADNEAAYIAIAGRIANDIPALIKIRRTLRKRFAASPVCDADQYMRSLEDVYRTTWRRKCSETTMNGFTGRADATAGAAHIQ